MAKCNQLTPLPCKGLMALSQYAYQFCSAVAHILLFRRI